MSLSMAYGFFYQMGSKDVPNNMNANSNFGFEVGSTTPVFKYTLNDVEKSFNSPQLLSKDGFYDASMRNVFMTESNGNSTLKTEDVTSSAWAKSFRVLEYLYNNQSTFIQGADNASFSCKGDEVLGSQYLSGSSVVNPYYIDTYIAKSLTYEISSIAGRVRYVTFQITFASSIITITAYFDANAFVERDDGVRYYVYRYIDSEPEDSIITQTEFKNGITTKLFDILKEGRYNSWIDYYVDKRTGESTYVSEQFFIFTSLNTNIPDSTKRVQVKKYLLDYYNNDTTKLRYTYPSLFDENSVYIIPMYDNKVTYASGTQADVHAVSIGKLRSTLSTFGFDITESSTNYRPTEIFHVGAGTGFTPANGSRPRYVYPFLAIEVDIESAITLPITTRMNDYVPIYGSIESSNAATFHSILMSLLDYLTGVSQTIDSTLTTSYEVTIYKADASHDNRPYVTFKFLGTLWTVIGTRSA